jgi:hypothetical protein
MVEHTTRPDRLVSTADINHDRDLFVFPLREIAQHIALGDKPH